MTTVVFSLGEDISTDVIYPGRYMATVLPSETPQFAFADHAEFNARLTGGKIPPGSVIVAEGFARIFLQNAINLGLNLVAAPGIRASVGDELEIGPHTVKNLTTGAVADIVQMPKARQAIMEAGGLIPYTRTRLLDQLQRNPRKP